MKKLIGTIIQTIFILIIPLVVLFYIGMLPYFELDDVSEYILKAFIYPVLLFYFSYIVSIALHELGHLIMGIKNRGSLIEYNFWIFSIYKANNKLKFKLKGKTTGLGGICIIDFPHDIKLSEFKEFCYGGPCINFILFIIFSILAILSLKNDTLLLVSLLMASMNLGFGLSNIIPYETVTGIETDGMKIYRAKTEKNYIENITKGLKIQDFLKKGGDIKDIPEDLIYKPDAIVNKSDMEMMIFYISKTIDQKKYDEAKKLIDECLSDNNKDKISVISKNNLKLSLIDIYLETDDIDKIKEIYDESLFKYVEMLCKFEKSINVYMYLYYVINDDNKANTIRKDLEKYYEENTNSKMAIESKRIFDLIKHK